MGLNFSFFDILDFSVSSNRGKNVAIGVTTHYNIGKSKGLFPKYLDPPLLCDFIRSESDLSKTLVSAFKDGGFDLMKISAFVAQQDQKCLSLQIINQRYRDEKIVKKRINNILSNVEIDDYQNIIVRVESEALALHEYKFTNKYLKNFKEKKIGEFEFEALSPIEDFCIKEDERYEKIIFKNKKNPWNLTVRPKINAFFGACRGKFKYDAGALANLEGFLPEGSLKGSLLNDLYYNLQISYIAKLSSAKVGSRDRYNPSQIIHVRSDFVKYFETNTFHVDNAYVQKNMNLSKKMFGKIALGYFELAYAGIAIEALYYPACSNFAFSIEAANIYKRTFTGLGFQKKIRKWNNTKEEFEKFIGFQYFLNLFLDFKFLDLSLRTSIGQFLAKDKGIKLELFKYFKSGFEISIWTTFTDKVDIVNNKRYFDKGFSITIPMDLFMNKSSRKKVNFKMSEWLRDVGAKAYTGKELYPIIHDERNSY